MWARDKCSVPQLEMDSRYTSATGIGDLNQLSAAIPATRVEVSVSCRNLLDRDTFSKSDPICVLYTQAVGNKEWREFGRTEVIDNTLNPDFVRKFILDYFFEERENLRFDLYDVDSKSPNLSKHRNSRQEMWDNHTDGRGAKLLQGCCLDAVLCKQIG
uniref:Copine VIII n=1 Tax=Mus musculus TaxID=10090 RepID=Q9CYR4_MOUSE|nr:unnamed protein product [Mus musculus]